MVYTLGSGADFICVEPVSHTVDAHNMGARNGVKPPVWLEKGQKLSGSVMDQGNESGRSGSETHQYLSNDPDLLFDAFAKARVTADNNSVPEALHRQQVNVREA